MNAWLLILITAVLAFVYAVSLPGDDGERSVGWPPSPTSSESRCRRQPHGRQHRDSDRIWHEFDHTDARGPQ